MTSLFYSKWLAGALALLVLVLAAIRTSHALKCYFCAEGEAQKDCLTMVCPDEEYYRAFGFPSTKEVHAACMSLQKGKDKIIRVCTPNGKRWEEVMGGPDKCVSEKDTAKQAEVERLGLEEGEENEIIGTKIGELVEANANYQQGSGPPLTPEMLKQLLLLLKFQPKKQGRGLNDGDKYKICACNKDLCNDDGYKVSSAVSGFEFRSGAIIILAALACLSLLQEF